MTQTEPLTKTQQRWVEKAVPKIATLAKHMHRRLPRLGQDELESVGYEALVLAARRYDPDSGVPFSGYAYYRARGAMIDAVRQADPHARRHRRALRTLEATQAVLEDAQRREGAMAAEDRRTLEERVAAAARMVEATAAAVLVAHAEPEKPERVETDQEGAEESLARDEIAQVVRRAVYKLDAKERALIEGVFFRGSSMKEYARELGLSASTVSRRVGKILQSMAEHLRQAGVGPPDTGPP